MSRRWVKRLVWFGLVPLVVLAGVVWLLGWLALRQITPDNITLQIESTFNCRARVDECALTLFSVPAHLQLSGVQLSPRDAAADNATPPSTREPAELHATYLKVRTATLDLDLGALILRRELSVRRFVIDGADVKLDLLAGGENTLRTLFTRPSTVKGRLNPAVIAAAPVAVAIKATTPAPAPDPGKKQETADPGEEPVRVLNARDLPVSSTLDRVALEDSRIRLRNPKSRSVIELNGCTLAVTDLSIDPAHLDLANRATVNLRSRLFVDGKKAAVRYAELDLQVSGRVTPFEPATGNLNPDLIFDVVLKQGSMVQSLPVMQKLQKSIDKAQQAGLKMKDLTAEARLLHDSTLKLRMQANRLQLAEPAMLDFADYSLHLDPKSYVDAGTETHEFRASVMASQAVSAEALKGADEFLARLGEEAGSELRKLFITPMVKDGRVTVAFVSTGDLGEPKVKADLPFQGVKDQIEGVSRQLLDGFKERKEPKEKRAPKPKPESQDDAAPPEGSAPEAPNGK